jgi:hypothetical protein
MNGLPKINTDAPTKPRPSTAKPAVSPGETGCGCLVLLLLTGMLVGFINSCTDTAHEPPLRQNQQARQKNARPKKSIRKPRPDDYVPPPLGHDPRVFWGQMYRDLVGFRKSRDFFDVGFSQSQRFYTWQDAVQRHAIDGSPEAERAWGKDWLPEWIGAENERGGLPLIPSDLMFIGLKAYSSKQWPYDETSRDWNERFGGTSPTPRRKAK